METIQITESNIVELLYQEKIFLAGNRVLGDLDAEILQYANVESRKATFKDIDSLIGSTICVWELPHQDFGTSIQCVEGVF